MNELTELRVFDYTTPSPITVQWHERSGRIFEILELKKIRHLPVLDGSKIVGLISERDMKHLSYYNERDCDVRACDLMSKDPFVVYMNDPLDEVALKMSEKKIGSAIVQDSSGCLVGIFTSIDALNALIDVVRGDVEVDNEMCYQ